MRTKSLLLAAAALAAGVIASQAQSAVYSANIVGYVNQTLNPGYNLIGNPLSAGVTNGANEVYDLTKLPDGSVFLIFNGAGFNQTLYSPSLGINGDGSPWYDPNSLGELPPPTLSPGEGFYYYNPGPATNLTYVGTVAPALGTTNSVTLPPGYSMVSSQLPVAGSVTNSTVNLTLIDGTVILTFNGSSYDQTLYSPSLGINGDGSPWYDPNSLGELSAPSLSVGQAIFYYNPGATTNWSQHL